MDCFLDRIKNGLNKKTISTMLAGLLVFSNGEAIVKANAYSFDKPKTTYEDFQKNNNVKIFINGRFVDFNDDMGYPLMVEGTTYIPVRTVSEAYNAYINWNNEESRVSVCKNGTSISMKVGSQLINVIPANYNFENTLRRVDKEIFTNNGRVYIPLRLLFETFGDDVIWNGDTSTIFVKSNYDENTKYIDFKDENVINIDDIDLTKQYKKIVYDGEIISKDYINILKNCEDYKVIYKNDVLYIFSHQYLFDVNRIYEAHYLVKNGEYDYNKPNAILKCVSEEEISFLSKLSFIDGYGYNYLSDGTERDINGITLNVRSCKKEEQFSKVDEIVNSIVKDIKNKTNDPKEMVKLVNEELCRRLTYNHDYDNDEITYTPYEALVENNTICGGYANTFKYIMDKLGIPCVNVGARSIIRNENHAYNLVYVDSEWKIVDVTFNDSTGQHQKYLLLDEDDDYTKDIFTSDKVKLMETLVRLTLKMN